MEPADVQEWVIKNGFCDEFIIHYVDCDPAAFDGLYLERQGNELIRHAVVYGEPIFAREIFINERLHEAQRRVAEVKETLHILDQCGQKTTTKRGVDDMISFAATRMKLGHDGGALTDVMALPQALAVLFPWAARELIKPKYDEGLISAEELAQTARLPVAYIELVLSDRWEDSYQIIINIENGFAKDAAE
ncbi:hypothetical protein [Brevundimonas sp. DC300-4]|uniref:hypothetical protein n=1 Tax=Brevundimonas sp. DC300-4 TaxID=2804594 RepID=UPI003CEDC11A